MQTNTRLGIMLMILTTFIFAIQDGISQHLAVNNNVVMIVMIRYWFFAAFVIAIARRQSGSSGRQHAPNSPCCRSRAARCWRWKSASWSRPSSIWDWSKAMRSLPAIRC